MSLTRYFGAANIGEGFKSYFGEIFFGLDMLYIIKGGPGTGKSTFMKDIAKVAEKKQYEVEYYYCSSDPDSVDGIIIPELSVGIVDGTSPHTLDPVYPIVKEKILDFGAFINGETIKEYTEDIVRLTDQKTEKYKNLYNYISAVSRLEAEMYRNGEKAVDLPKLKAYTDRLTKKWRKGNGFEKIKRCNEAVTSKGKIVFDTFEEKSEKTYYINDSYYAGNSFFGLLIEKAKKLGLKTLYSPDSVFPDMIRALYFPELSLCFTVSDKKSDHTVNMGRFVDKNAISKNKQKSKFIRRCLSSLYEGAFEEFGEIKRIHESLERFYISAMDFEKKNEMKEKILKEIFS